MAAAGVKKQYTKFQVLSTILPKKVQDEVKTLLCRTEADYTEKEAEGRNTYRIRVKAREIDESPPLESQEMTYVIEIEDENDNGPRIGDATKIEGTQ